MCQRWAGTAGVDYHNSCHNDTVEIGNLKVSRDALNPLLNPSERKLVIMNDITDMIWHNKLVSLAVMKEC
jgi:hypothetical protein